MSRKGGSKPPALAKSPSGSLFHGQQTATIGIGGGSTGVASVGMVRPVWMADSAAPVCCRCSAKFGTFRRRHHCRSCGRIFCKECSDRDLPIPALGYNEAIPCFASLTSSASFRAAPLQQSEPTSPAAKLPTELLVAIFGRLDLGTVATVVPLVCRRWRDAAASDSLWQALYCQQWRISSEFAKGVGSLASWRTVFVDKYIMQRCDDLSSLSASSSTSSVASIASLAVQSRSRAPLRSPSVGDVLAPVPPVPLSHQHGHPNGQPAMSLSSASSSSSFVASNSAAINATASNPLVSVPAATGPPQTHHFTGLSGGVTPASPSSLSTSSSSVASTPSASSFASTMTSSSPSSSSSSLSTSSAAVSSGTAGHTTAPPRPVSAANALSAIAQPKPPRSGPAQINALKIVLLGATGAGKTAFVAALQKKPIPETHVATRGALPITRNVPQPEGRLVPAQLWDTAGGQRYATILKNYYSSANAAILLYDVTSPESWDTVVFWQELLAKERSSLPLAVFGNKSDLPARVATATVQEWATAHAVLLFREGSARTGANVEDFLVSLCRSLKAA